ncbi:MAG: sigma-54-dependent Fis family transcriptional regulator [Bryobacterales bacterium]|nr:sigma-54-dependent Fis family transcriptional regulator [Bryobacterales bacterium]
MAHIFLIDDDTNTLASLARAFRLAGHQATVCDNAARALELLQAGRYDVIFSDVVMPGKDGLSLLEDLKNLGVAAPVVMISGQATVEMAVRATRLGAVDFLEKPLSTDKLLLTVANILRLASLEAENRQLRQKVGRHEIVWQGEAMRRVMAQVERVAATETRIAILGETGTGKELVARTLHEKSRRAGQPFVTLNCAAVPSELIESELFGHEKGAFTGAGLQHAGRFEQAHRGTLFLDEVGDMPLAMQAKLLRVLEAGEVERIGGTRAIPVDVRLLVATHRDLEDLVRRGGFREDLFHRVYVFPLSLPPLRDRLDDLPALVKHFSEQVAAQNGWKPRHVAPGALEALARYGWPGNVRELRNVVERLLLLSDDAVDEAAVLRALPSLGSRRAAHSGSLAQRVEQFEREAILEELESRGYQMTETARALGLERSHLYKKCQQLGIDLQRRRQGGG